MVFTLPNTLSGLRIILSPVFFVLFISEDHTLRQLSVLVFLVAAVTDWYDGVLARSYNEVTNVGKFLDPLADKVLTSFAFIAFAFIGLAAWWMVIAIIVRDLAITALRSLAETRGAHITTSKSAQTKTFVQMAVLYYLLVLTVGRDMSLFASAEVQAVLVQLLDPVLVTLLMLAVTLLTLATGVQYLIDNRRFLHTLMRRSASA